MVQISLKRNPYFKAFLACMAILLSIAYIFFSYNRTYEYIQNRNKELLLKEKEEISSALQKYNQYLSLLESRLLHALHKDEIILRILGEKLEPTLGTTFPTIMHLEFIPAYNPAITFTRLGTTITKEGAKLKESKEEITYLGRGVFKTNKILRDRSNQIYGKLQITFSISPLLYKHFSENEVQVLQEQNVTRKNALYSFKITDFPYLFVISKNPLTFWQFILSMKFQIISIFILGLALLVVGIGVGVFLNQKILLRQRGIIQKLKEKLTTLDEKYTTSFNKLVGFESLLRLKDQEKKVRTEFYGALQERYRQMAAQAQSINMLTSKLILDEAGNDKLLKEIHSISQEGTTVLRQLVNGFPMKEKEESIDVLQSIEKIKTLFLPELVERNIQFTATGKIKKPPQADQVIFDIVLHNLFYLVMARLLKNNVFQIELVDSDPFEIIFYDNGFDVEEKLQKVKVNPDSDSIWSLEKVRLKDFINYLGWNISFQKEGPLLNSIKLSIPRNLKEKELPSNVVNLFDYKPNAI